ncbi:hypothetical protein NAEGRDRAFT_80888 [Naegleria gruberi]|uniref:Zn(2)-C6 fungal-type domain-containing protein n=1 Tax=Naegleria gruberi TaxID=5762 RepID=D2VQN7_NAEGR|nr:uncharacterized protein NAEGRDRAFT_80888 [Naegleria gruberi]EFC40981.1 hypothetical protein NAEGRDRAFT_80888 [Naegleria gruberi]|eukprot:XP_002673725.1 hypothetical protein NAEGRDRAFT_80888 [Naegleria gruberi strain NEG-M]
MPKQTTYPGQGGSNGNNNNHQQHSQQQQQNNSESNNNLYNLRYQGPQSAFQSSNTSNALHFLHQFEKQQGGATNQPSLFNLLDGSTSTMASDEMAHYYQRLFSGNNNNTNSNNNLLNAMSANVNTPGSSSSNSNSTNPSAFVSPLPPASTPLADSLSYYLEQLGLPNQNKGGLLAPSTSSSSLLGNSSAGTNNTTSANANQQISKSASSDKISTLLNNINNHITSSSNNNLPMTSPTSSSSLSSSSGSNGQHVEESKKKKKKKPVAPESDEDEEMQMEGDESGGLFHPIACVQCRRLHKRCDRKLPACSKCVSRGVNCEYKIPRKKGRTAKPKTSTEGDQSNRDIASSLPSWEGVSMNPPELDRISTNTAPQMADVDVRRISEMNMCIFNTTNAGVKPLHSSTTKLLANILSSETPYGNIAKTPEKHLDKRKVLDLYFNIFGNGMPVIERKDFEGYLSSKSNNSKDDDEEIITEGNDIMPNKKEVYAMFLAIKAICEQRTGLSDLAEETMKKAREALSKFFDEHSNFYVSCCYAFMCIYESGCGRLKTAKYYLQSVNFYLDELSEEEQQNLTIYQKNLKKIRSFCKVCSSNDSGVLSLLKDWPNVFEKTLGIQIPTEWRTLLEQDLTPNNYSTMIKVVETLLHIVRMHLTKTGSERNLKIFDMGSTIVFHGIRLGILSAVNRGKELIEESALKITFGTENELFLFVPPPIVAHVAAAAKVHLHIVKSIEAGERQNPEVMMVPTVNYGEEPRVGTVDYYEILAKDLRALNILSKRYKKVSLFHKTLMQEMEEIINRKHLMSALNLFTSHSLNDGSKQPTDLPQFTQNFSSGSLPTTSIGSSNSTNSTTPSSTTSSLPTVSNTSNRSTTTTNPLSGFSNDIFSHYNLSEFSEFQNVKNTKDFFSVIANPKNNNKSNNPINMGTQNQMVDPPTINWQDMINGSGLNLNLGNNLGFGLASPVPNMNAEPSLQNESFFEPFLDNDDMQEIYSFAYDEALGPFMNNSD